MKTNTTAPGKMTIYTEVVITPHHSGFGMFERGEVQSSPDNSYAFDSDLLQVAGENSDSVLPIDEAIADADFIALGVQDIRGKIYNQPDQVFARIDRGELSYFGIVANEVPEDFFGQ